ncbi:fibronectin type III domain-containing protein [Parapedobacter sp. 10938]|uniref:fibronectin type III domain-containing protein n=1 Tax=Parapedobacter flavus TaxID=3110225 RepID=UPI002DBFC9F3|nr:fibronectin type III domain-containing protein [Parapedobacter sp. 10938]MEC3881105.1 fibronectin type III domain-containing protein [Parapedobacter sp. 10938]
MAYVIYDFSKEKDADLDALAESIITKLTDNEHFPDPEPALATVRRHLEAYRGALVEAAGGDRLKGELKRACKKQLAGSLRSLALYVERESRSDRAAILSAGMELRKSAERIDRMPLPHRFRVKYGEPGSGTAVVSAGRFEPALMYRFDYRLAGSGEWTTVISSYSRITIDGLQSYRHYEFRAAYIGRGIDPEPRFGETITTIIL